jgi:predicted PurR-regulated permease PerM
MRPIRTGAFAERNNMEKSSITNYFLVFLIIAIIYACYLIFKPFLGELLIATILVTLLYTPYEKLVKLFHGRRNLASALMVFLIILLIILPLVNFLTYTAQRSIDAYGNVVAFINAGGLNQIASKIIDSPFTKFISSFGFSMDSIQAFVLDKANLAKAWVTSSSGILTLVSGASGLIAGTANFIISLVIIIFSMFFFFTDGKKMVEKIMYWTPFPNKYDKAIFKKFKDVSSSTIISTFVTAIAQGLIGALGFLIVGFPIFFTSIALAFASIIPYVGTALVWAPVGLYLLLIGKIWQGIFLIIWGAVVIGNSDNLIKAYLIKDKAEVHPLFIVFSILGGLSLFGFWGIIYGPLIIALAVTILHIYEMEYESVLEK